MRLVESRKLLAKSSANLRLLRKGFVELVQYLKGSEHIHGKEQHCKLYPYGGKIRCAVG